MNIEVDLNVSALFKPKCVKQACLLKHFPH